MGYAEVIPPGILSVFESSSFSNQSSTIFSIDYLFNIAAHIDPLIQLSGFEPIMHFFTSSVGSKS